MESLLNFFSGQDRPVLSYKPLKILSGRPADQLLSGCAQNGVVIPSWLEKKISYRFDTRTIHPDDQPSLSVLTCDVRTSNIISASCDELLRVSIPLESRYVQIHKDGDDPRIVPKSQLVGKVVRVEDEKLVLEDFIPGYETIEPSKAYLEPRRENLSWCLSHLFPGSSQQILDRLDGVAAKLQMGPERLKRIKALLSYLQSEPLEVAPGLTFTLGQPFKERTKNRWFPNCEVIRKPILVFDPGNSPPRTDVWNERGIDEHGPYDQRFFSPKRPRVALICQAQSQGQVEQFIHKFIEGLPTVISGSGKYARAPYAKGFRRRYALEKIDVHLFTAADSRAVSYRSACRQAIEFAAQENEPWNLAFIQIDEAFHQLRGDENPYLITKSMFMKQQIPVQEITLEKMTSPNSDLVFIMNDISIATYAKLGGVPWILKSDSPISHELVIGLGGHHLSESRLGAKERIVGITTVFSSSGDYLLESKTAAVPYEGYAEALLTSLRKSIETIREEQNWKSTDSVRLIFHTFQQVKDTEVTVVDKVMSELGLPNVQYAFVHFVDDHPLILFDENQQGAFAPGGIKKGALAAERGTMLRLGQREALVSFTGPRDLKQAKDGIPKPILLRLHRNSTFKDLTYIARQAFNFSCHSWRTFSSAPLPVTILYSELIARLLRELEDVSDWDPDAMLSLIGRTRWFL